MLLNFRRHTHYFNGYCVSEGGCVLACTIRDIAQAANVSASTVSLVLRGKENRISEETKLRVRQIAEQMHYVPNQVAVSLVTKKLIRLG